MPTVYRIENEFGHGPYQSINLSASVVTKLQTMYDSHVGFNHPTPATEFGWENSIGSNEYCGFISKEQMRRWFDGYAQILSDCEFLVSVYDVPQEYIRSATAQALIYAVHSWPRISQHNPTEMFD